MRRAVDGKEIELTATEYKLLLTLVERLDGLPRHVAVHPCGVLLSDSTLLDRTPVEAIAMQLTLEQRAGGFDPADGRCHDERMADALMASVLLVRMTV